MDVVQDTNVCDRVLAEVSNLNYLKYQKAVVTHYAIFSWSSIISLSSPRLLFVQ